MNRKFLMLLGCFAALALVAAGCGGSDDGGDSTTTTVGTDTDTTAGITKQEFITQADAICEAGNSELDSTFSAGRPSEQDVTDTVVPAFQSQHDDIEALGAPEGDEDEIAALLDSLQNGIDDLKDDPSSLFETSSFDDANQRASDYGLKVCAQD